MRKTILGILAFCGLGYFFYDSLMGAVGSCKELEATTRNAIYAAAENCTSDQDCTLMGLTCPYDCLIPMNQSAKPQVLAALGEYNASCMTVCPDCPKDRSAKAVCVDTRCTVIR